MIILSVQTFPPDAGGKQVLMESLANAAAIQTDVLVLADKIREGRKEQPKKTSYKIKRYGGIKALRQRRKAQEIARLAEQYDVTHLFCDSWRSAEHLPQDLPCSVTIYAHGNEYALGGVDGDKAKARRIAKSFAKIDHIISVSKPTAKRVEAYFPSNADKSTLPTLHVINNPVAAPALVTEREIDQAEFLWPVENKSTTRLLALSRLIPLKGIDHAIEAMKRLTDEGKSLQMVIAGEGEDKTRLETLVNDYGLQDRTRFIGHVSGPEKTALFDSADIFVQPGRKIGEHEEGFGLTYLEAALQGIPSLCGQAGGAPEAVLHDKTGLVVDGGHVKDVTDGLRRLIDEPQQTSHMGKAAQAHAQALLWDKQIIPILDRVKEIRGTRRG